ncbi:MAG: class D sortase [Vallitaleaceae bacterium]|jgi:sortase A|nr:class D sortase [Vallitaleaceae bacterium]
MDNYDEKLKESVDEIEDKKLIKRKIKIRNTISTLLIIGGLSIIAIPIIGRLVANNQQKDMLDEFYTSLEQSNNEVISTDLDALNDALLWGSDETNQAESNQNDITVSSGNQLAEPSSLQVMPKTLGVIKIDKIDLEYPIGEGADLDTLRYYIGHVPESAPLNEIGNSVLAGHRSHSFGSYFNRLDELEIGDEIEVTSINGETITYEVFDKLIVAPDDFSVMKGSSQYRVLTLITCHPVYNPDSRLIIHAIDVDQLDLVASK